MSEQTNDTLPQASMADVALACALAGIVLSDVSALGVPSVLAGLARTCCVPLVFMASGWRLHPKAKPTGAFARAEAKRYLVPYGVFAFVYVFIAAIRSLAGAALATAFGAPGSVAVTAVPATVGQALLAAVCGMGATVEGGLLPMPAIGVLWLCWGLFWARLLCASARQTTFPLVVVLWLFVAAWMMRSDRLLVPFSLQAGMMGSFFVYAGQELRRKRILTRSSVPAVLWATFAFVWLYCGWWFSNVQMATADFGDGMVNFVGAMAGSLCLLGVSQGLVRQVPAVARVLSRLGEGFVLGLGAHALAANLIPYPLLLERLAVLGGGVWVVVLAIHLVVVALLWFAFGQISHHLKG